MTRLHKVLLIAAVLVLASCPLWMHAQQGPTPTLVQQAQTDQQGCTTTNNTAAVSTTETVTITPPNGLSVYLCGMDITISNDNTGTSVITNLSFTSTNIGGWALKFSDPGTANTTRVFPFLFVRPVKATTPGTAVTIVSPAGNTHIAYSTTAYYYFAP